MRKLIVLLWLSVFLIYIAFASFNRYGPNPGSKFMLTKSIALYNQLNVSEEDIEFYAGKLDYSFKDGKYFSDKPPGISFLSLPFYYLGKSFHNQSIEFPKRDTFNYDPDVNAFFLIIIFLTALTSVGVATVYKIASIMNFSKTTSLIIMNVFGFSTIFWGYATTMFSHAIAATLYILTVYFLLSFLKKGNKYKLFLCLFILGTATTIEYTTFFLIPIFLLFLFFKSRKKHLKTFFVSLIFLSIPILLLGLYNLFAFGSPFNFSYHYTVVFKNVFNVNKPLLDGLNLLLVSKQRGLFFFNPVLILSFIGVFLFKEYKQEKILLTILIILFIVLFATNDNALGGISYGPRFLISIIPFIIILLLPAFDKKHVETIIKQKFTMKIYSIFLAMLIVISFFHSFLGVYVTIYIYPESNPNPIYEINLPKFLQDAKESYLLINYPTVFYILLISAVLIQISVLKKSNFENLLNKLFIRLKFNKDKFTYIKK